METSRIERTWRVFLVVEARRSAWLGTWKEIKETGLTERVEHKTNRGSPGLEEFRM